MPTPRIVYVSLGLAALAVGLFGYQTIRVNRLERRLSGRPAAATAGPEAPRERAGRRARSEGGSEDTAALRRRILAVERALTTLVGHALSAQGKAGEAVDPVLQDWVKQEIKSMRSDVDGVLTGESLATEDGRKRLKQVLQEARSEERAERHERWGQLRDVMVKEQLAELAKATGLPAEKVEQIQTLLTDERTQRRTLRQGFQQGEKTAEEFIAGQRALRQATDEKVKGMVSEEQYQAYEKMRKQGGGGRGFR
jgi:hypothetical protein